MSKALSFSVMHFIIAFSLTFALTGDLFVGGMVAIIEPTINSIAYVFHEAFWQRKLKPLKA